MQTFLPYPNFVQTAKCLDYRRLGKQRIECVEILKNIRYGGGWVHHPAVKMWANHIPLLAEYGRCMCEEWVRRGYKDSRLALIQEYSTVDTPSVPDWIGNAAFHISHQSNLVRKNPEYYRVFFPYVPDNIPYLWPKC